MDSSKKSSKTVYIMAKEYNVTRWCGPHNWYRTDGTSSYDKGREHLDGFHPWETKENNFDKLHDLLYNGLLDNCMLHELNIGYVFLIISDPISIITSILDEDILFDESCSYINQQ